MKLIALCYNHKTDMAIGKFNSITGEENPSVTFTNKLGEEVTFYYESCPETKNYTKITIPSKRINRDKYIQAVKSQLLYFSNIDFYTIDESGYSNKVDFKAKILYNSDNIIISDNNYYSKPHILIVKDSKSTEAVCYGFVDFREMEMEELFSSVGVKCTIRSTIRNENGEEVILQEGISVSPSRESVIWDEHSRNYIINKFKAVQDEASELVSAKLNDTDLLTWVEKASNVLNNSGSDPILHRLSKIIDKNEISPLFPANKQIRYFPNLSLMFKGFTVYHVAPEYNYSISRDEIKRTISNDKSLARAVCIYFKTKEEEWNKYRDFYLTKVVLPGKTGNSTQPFIIIEEKDINTYLETNFSPPDGAPPDVVEKYKAVRVKEKIKVEQLLAEIKKSEHFKLYSDVVVDETWLESFKKSSRVDEVDGAAAKPYVPTPAELRRLNEAVVLYSPAIQNYHSPIDPPVKYHKEEPKLSALKDLHLGLNYDEGYYGGVDDQVKLEVAAYCIATPESKVNNWSKYKEPSFGTLSKTPILRLSNNLHKHAKNLNPISFFFKHITPDNCLTMSKHLINWYTGYIIYQKLHKLKFLTNYRIFNSDMAEAYNKLSEFVIKHYREIPKFSANDSFNTIASEMMIECQKILDMQLFVSEHIGDDDAIKEKSKELFAVDFIKDGKAINNDMYELLLEVEEYAESVYPLFNSISFLKEKDAAITPEQEALINEFLGYKNLSNVQIKNPLINNLISDESTTDNEQLTVGELTES